MHQLHEHFRALRVHAVNDNLPARDLRRGKHTGNARIAESVGGRRCALGEDQADAGSLCVILSHQLIRDIADGPIAGHRAHDQAVLQGQRANGRLRK